VSDRGSGRGWLPAAAAVAAALALLLVLAALDRGGDVPLDPRSHARLGTSAMVALARELGAEVDVGGRVPDLGAGTGPDVIVVLTDVLDPGQREALMSWVERGGRLVVTDPGSALVPEWTATFDTVAELGLPRTLASRCEIGALDGIDVAGIAPRNGGVLYRPRGAADTCVEHAGGAYIVATGRGEGSIVAVGGSGMVVNAAIARGENAPVVAALVAPERGTGVLVLEPGAVAGAGGGERTLAELVPSGVWRAIAQLGLAFLVYALWRARRLGRPVAETQPVAVAGSELVVAVGNLLDRTGSTAHAADLLRADLRRFLANHLGMPPASPPGVLAEVAAARSGADPDRLRWALDPRPVTGDADLVALAHTIDRIREEVLAHV
jgi:hypothetical protein